MNLRAFLCGELSYSDYLSTFTVRKALGAKLNIGLDLVRVTFYSGIYQVSV